MYNCFACNSHYNACYANGVSGSPEITVFVDPIHKVIQASCCIDGIITYFEVYEDRDPAVGVCQLELESPHKDPHKDPHEDPELDPYVVQLLEEAICNYSRRYNSNLTLLGDDGYPVAMPENKRTPTYQQERNQQAHLPINNRENTLQNNNQKQASLDTPLIRPDLNNNCCQLPCALL